MKLLVTGDRNWVDNIVMHTVLLQIYHNNTDDAIYLVHGNCRGADVMALKILSEIAIQYPKCKIIDCKMSANWNRYGKAAGPIRNSEMLLYHSDIDLYLAFHNNIEKSVGTKDMINKIIKSNKTCWLIHNNSIDNITKLIK